MLFIIGQKEKGTMGKLGKETERRFRFMVNEGAAEIPKPGGEVMRVNDSYVPHRVYGGSYYNVGGMCADVSKMFRDVDMGHATFYLLSASPNHDTVTTIQLLRKDLARRPIREEAEVNHDLLREYIVGKMGPTSRLDNDAAKELFVVYHRDNFKVAVSG